jgi:hypothetical protein
LSRDRIESKEDDENGIRWRKPVFERRVIL